MGSPKRMFRPMAAPKISAREVEIEAPTALARIRDPAIRGRYFAAASERQSPVTIPKWAALCCRIIKKRVERVTIQRREYPYWDPAAMFAAQFPGSMKPTVTR